MTTVEACIHAWKIDAPNGPFSSGACRKCGEVRHDFKNGEEDFRYGPGEGHDAPMSAAQHERAVLAANAGRRKQAKRWPMPTAPGVRTDH